MERKKDDEERERPSKNEDRRLRRKARRNRQKRARKESERNRKKERRKRLRRLVEETEAGDVERTDRSVVRTILTNPGIISRVRSDVSRYDGFDVRYANRDGVEVAILYRQKAVSDPRESRRHPGIVVRCVIRDASLVPTVGPFIRTLVRLVTDMDTRNISFVVDLDFEFPDPHGRSVGAERRYCRNVVHMLVRNSMGAALFLNLTVIVRERSRDDGDEGHKYGDDDDGGDVDDDERDTYPSVVVVERSRWSIATIPFRPKMNRRDATSGYLIPASVLQGFDATRMHLQIDVRGRSDTFHMSPILFHLACRLGQTKTKKSSTTSDAAASTTSPSASALHIVCVEKPPNLHRILSLFRTYNLLSRLYICARSTQIELFREIVANDVQILSNGDRRSRANVRVCSFEEAASVVRSVRKISPSSAVAVDVDPAAIVLRFDDRDRLLPLLRNPRGCVLWGFEKDGIPACLAASTDSKVEVKCRSSLNLAVAVSIVLHATAGW